MGFSPAVVDSILLACGRHCVLCHRHVGLKIELHHIIPKADGGDDSEENCIPLCFDCHADMRGYDFKHPKGRKYSVSELKARRQQWAARYASTGGVTASIEHLALDRVSFLRLRRVLAFEQAIRPLMEMYNGGPIPTGCCNILAGYYEEPVDAATEFLDADLERLRLAVRDRVGTFCTLLGQWTFPHETLDAQALPVELKYRDPLEYGRRADAIGIAANELVAAYEDMVRAGRRKLGVDLSEASA